jgi:uroporphyrinogen decarboxylase
MNSFERVLQAINFKESDRVPLDICGTTVSGIAITPLKKLLKKYNYESKIDIPDYIQQIGIPSSAILSILNVDTKRIGPDRITDFDRKVIKINHQKKITDFWNIEYLMKENDYYFNQVSWPLVKENNLKDAILAYNFPKPDKNYLEKVIQKKAKKNSIFFPILDRDCAGLLEMSTRLRGVEKFFMDLYLEKKSAEALIDKIFEYKLAFWDIVLHAFGKREVIVSEADDYGTESSLLVSPKILKDIFFSKYKQLFKFIKKKSPQAKIFFHSCGAIREIIPDLIDMGVDILNPIQYKAVGMDLKNLKKDFGKDIVFWGGGIDTQRILPFGTTTAVKDEVKKVLDIMAPGGGYIFATVHNIQADVPIKNIISMLKTLKIYGKY